MSDHQELVTVRRRPLQVAIGLLIFSVIALGGLAAILITNVVGDSNQGRDIDQIRQVVCNGNVVIPDDRRVLDSGAADRLVKLCGKKGPTGQEGDRGGLGPAGPTGLQGPVGMRGQDGSPGINGATGAQGLRGFEGEQGPRGRRGRRGPPGPEGAPGQDGRPAPGIQQTNETLQELRETVTSLSATVDSISSLLCRLLQCP